MNQYIIDESMIVAAENNLFSFRERKADWAKDIRSHPYNPQAEQILKDIMELVDCRIYGLDNLLATPPEQRTESAQDKYIKEARFELGLVQDEYKELRQEGKVESPRCKYDMIPERCASVGHDGICYCSEHLDQCPHFKEGKVAK